MPATLSLSFSRASTSPAASRRLARITTLGCTNTPTSAAMGGKTHNSLLSTGAPARYRRDGNHHAPRPDGLLADPKSTAEGNPEVKEHSSLGEIQGHQAAEVTVSTTTTTKTTIKAVSNKAATVCKETGDWSRAGIGTEEYESVCTGSSGRPYDILAKIDPEGDDRESKGMRLRYGGMREWAEQQALEAGHPGEEFVVHEDVRTRGSIRHPSR